jgi:hypothetical protein
VIVIISVGSLMFITTFRPLKRAPINQIGRAVTAETTPLKRRYDCSKRGLFDLSQIPQAVLVRNFQHEREAID